MITSHQLMNLKNRLGYIKRRDIEKSKLSALS